MTGPEVPDAEVIDGAELLDEVRAAYTRYVVFPSPRTPTRRRSIPRQRTDNPSGNTRHDSS